MKTSISLPSTGPEAYGEYVLDWAVAVEAAGFDSVAAIGSTAQPGFDPVVTLAAVGAATRKIDLLGAFLMDLEHPVRLLAGQLQSLDELVSHRLSLALGLGSVSDYFATLEEEGDSATALEHRVHELRAFWARPESTYAGTERPLGPPVLLGGRGEGAASLVARRADGWMGSAGAPEEYQDMVRLIEGEWSEAERTSRPTFLAACPFALGPRAEEVADRFVLHRYGTGRFAAAYRASLVTDPAQLRPVMEKLAEAGCDEVVFAPCSAPISQMELLAERVLGSDLR